MLICIQQDSNHQHPHCTESLLDTFDHTRHPAEKLKCVLNITLSTQRIWIKSNIDDTCAKLIVVRCVLELTVRQTLHYFTKVDIILRYYCIHIRQNIINLIHELSEVHVC